MAYSVNTFNFIQDINTRIMLSTAFNAVTQLELWDFIREFSNNNTSFTFSDDIRVSQIYNKIEELGYYGHSGASFGYTLREIEYIAINGLEDYEIQYKITNNILNKNILPEP
jgi:hypothetical protein